ncbi:putative quorum-quenching lactonase YtnP [compost metagenome]
MYRRISTLSGPARRLDGGSMFGSLPRRLWSKWFEPDQDNQIALAARAVLVQEPGRNVLILAGTEALLAPLPRSCRCQPQAKGLLDSLAVLGLGEGDIHAVILTHLQAQLPATLRGAVREGNLPRLLFPAARFITGARHWSRAKHPHPHDRALFVPQIVRELGNSERLELLDGAGSDVLGAGWRFHLSDGYTPGQLLPEIAMPAGPVVFAGDLIPGIHWLQLDVTTAYDRNPEGLIGEKERLLDHLVATRGRLLFARDPETALIKVTRDRRSNYQAFDRQRVLDRLDS